MLHTRQNSAPSVVAGARNTSKRSEMLRKASKLLENAQFQREVFGSFGFSAGFIMPGATAQLDPLQNSAAFVRGTSDSMCRAKESMGTSSRESLMICFFVGVDIDRTYTSVFICFYIYINYDNDRPLDFRPSHFGTNPSDISWLKAADLVSDSSWCCGRLVEKSCQHPF